jgi:DNA-directed RNA polymerase subunit RPC12/RpoP
MNDRNEHRTAAAEVPRIEVQCLSCGRFGSFEGDDIRVRGTPLVQLTRRLRCSACGSRAVKATTVRTPRDVAKLLRARMNRV